MANQSNTCSAPHSRYFFILCSKQQKSKTNKQQCMRQLKPEEQFAFRDLCALTALHPSFLINKYHHFLVPVLDVILVLHLHLFTSINVHIIGQDPYIRENVSFFFLNIIYLSHLQYTFQAHPFSGKFQFLQLNNILFSVCVTFSLSAHLLVFVQIGSVSLL